MQMVGNADHRISVLAMLRQIRCESPAMLLASMECNTVSDLLLSATTALVGRQASLLEVTSADQTVTDPVAFATAVWLVVSLVGGWVMVVLGFAVDRKEISYRYIRSESDVGAADFAQHNKWVDLDAMRRYLVAVRCNAGTRVFVLCPAVWLRTLKSIRANTVAETRTAAQVRTSAGRLFHPGKAEFARTFLESGTYVQ